MLPHEEKGSAMLQSIVQSSRIGSHSPKQQVNQKWHYLDVTLPSQAET
jgi:hypothetical protein